jgi:transposase
MDLTDDQWNAIQPLLPQDLNQGAGRPPQSSRRVLDAILWKLRTGASWNDLPRQYPSHQTCFRRYTEWDRSAVLESVIKALSKHLSRSGFNLQKAMQENEIECIHLAGKIHLHFPPRWQDTWQSSTVLLLVQVHMAKKRKLGEVDQKVTLSYQVSE